MRLSITCATRGCRLKPSGIAVDALAERTQPTHLHARLHPLRPVDLRVRRPVDGVLVADHAERGARLRPPLIEPVAVLLDHRRRIALGEHAFGDQLVRVDLASRRMLANDPVHHRLGRGRLVRLVMAMTPVANEIDHDVLAELHAVFERQARNKHHRLRIVRVDVEDRRLEHLRDVAGIDRRARVARIRSREANLVVDDQVHGAAGVVAARLRKLQRLHDHALPREGCIAVNQNRQHAHRPSHRRAAPGARAPSLRLPDSTTSRCDGLKASTV